MLEKWHVNLKMIFCLLQVTSSFDNPDLDGWNVHRILRSQLSEILCRKNVNFAKVLQKSYPTHFFWPSVLFIKHVRRKELSRRTGEEGKIASHLAKKNAKKLRYEKTLLHSIFLELFFGTRFFLIFPLFKRKRESLFFPLIFQVEKKAILKLLCINALRQNGIEAAFRTGMNRFRSHFEGNSSSSFQVNDPFGSWGSLSKFFQMPIAQNGKM